MSLITLPVTLVNNTVADATDVMSDLNTIVNVINGSLDTSNLTATLTFADNDYVDLGNVTHNDTAPQGLRLPQIGASPSSPSSGEGFLGWDQTNNTLEFYDGSSWTVVAGGITGMAVPAIILGTAAAAGSANTVVRTDATILAFDATVPTTIAAADAAATGSAAIAARRDHRHGAPSSFGSWQFVESLSTASGTSVTSATLPTDSDLFMVVFEDVSNTTNTFLQFTAITNHISIQGTTNTATANSRIAEFGTGGAEGVNGVLYVPRVATGGDIMCPGSVSYLNSGGVYCVLLLAYITTATTLTTMTFNVVAGAFDNGKIHIYKSVPS